MNTLNFKQLLEDIKAGKDQTLKLLYREHQAAFQTWAVQRFQLPIEDIQDVFQDAIIVFYKNVRTGKLTHLDASVKTYLFGIGKKLLLKRYTQLQKTTPIDDFQLPPVEMKLMYDINLDHLQEQLKIALSQLKETCRTILVLFYYKRYSLEAIMHSLNYNNTDTVKSRKLQCLKALRVAYFNIHPRK